MFTEEGYETTYSSSKAKLDKLVIVIFVICSSIHRDGPINNKRVTKYYIFDYDYLSIWIYKREN